MSGWVTDHAPARAGLRPDLRVGNQGEAGLGKPDPAERGLFRERHGALGHDRLGDVSEEATEIRGLGEAAKVPGVTVFHAGTKPDGTRVLANGGRVLNVTAKAATVAEAQAAAYAAVDRIDFATGFCRRDIAWRALS